MIFYYFSAIFYYFHDYFGTWSKYFVTWHKYISCFGVFAFMRKAYQIERQGKELNLGVEKSKKGFFKARVLKSFLQNGKIMMKNNKFILFSMFFSLFWYIFLIIQILRKINKQKSFLKKHFFPI